MNAVEKTQKLKEIIASKGSILVSFSGGADSALLAVITKDVLGYNMRCVLLDSPVVPRAAIAVARKIAEESGLHLEIIPVNVLDDERVSKNPPERCYWCRKKSAQVLKGKLEDLHFACIADGLNVSDTREHRPGLAASTDEGIIQGFATDAAQRPAGPGGDHTPRPQRERARRTITGSCRSCTHPNEADGRPAARGGWAAAHAGAGARALAGNRASVLTLTSVWAKAYFPLVRRK